MLCQGTVPSSPSSGNRGSHTDLTRSPRSTPLTAGLDIAALDRAVDYYFLNGLAPATRRSYESGKRRFLSFCEKVQAKPLPVSEKLLGQFISHSTIKCYLATVRHLQIAAGLGDPGISRMARCSGVSKWIRARGLSPIKAGYQSLRSCCAK